MSTAPPQPGRDRDSGVVAAALVVLGLAGIWLGGVVALSDLRTRDDMWDGVGFAVAGTWICLAAIVAGLAAVGLVRARTGRPLAWVATAAAMVLPLTYVGVGLAVGELPRLAEVGVPTVIVIAALACWQLVAAHSSRPTERPSRAGRVGMLLGVVLALLGLWGLAMGLSAFTGGVRARGSEQSSTFGGAVDRWLGLSAVALAVALVVLAVACGLAFRRGHRWAGAGAVAVGVLLTVGLLLGLGSPLVTGGVELPAVLVLQLRSVLVVALVLAACGLAERLGRRAR